MLAVVEERSRLAVEEGEVIFTVVVEEGCWQRQKNWKAKLAGWKNEQGRSVELRRHHAGRIMRWAPQIIGKDNGAVAQIVRNNIVAADIVRK